MSDNLYAIANSSLFVYLIEKREQGFALCRVDTVDQMIVSENLHPARAEALAEAENETRGPPLVWKPIPETARNPVYYIFDHEPRLTPQPKVKADKNTIPLAVGLIWADFAVTALIGLADNLAKGPGPASPLTSVLSMAEMSPWTAVILLTVVNLIFTLLTAIKVGRGDRRWRNAYAVSCLLTVVPFCLGFKQIFVESKLTGCLSLIQSGIELYAVWLLYTGYGQKWFKKT